MTFISNSRYLILFFFVLLKRILTPLTITEKKREREARPRGGAQGKFQWLKKSNKIFGQVLMILIPLTIYIVEKVKTKTYLTPLLSIQICQQRKEIIIIKG